jgi:formate dehydrogenase subunit gamma
MNRSDAAEGHPEAASRPAVSGDIDSPPAPVAEMTSGPAVGRTSGPAVGRTSESVVGKTVEKAAAQLVGEAAGKAAEAAAGKAGRVGKAGEAFGEADEPATVTAPEPVVGKAAGWAGGTGFLLRFARVPRWVHWTTAALFGVCLGSAAVLYVGPLSVLFGRRHLVEMVHVYSGYALPVPMLAGWLSAAYRADVRELDRFIAHDWAWLRVRVARLRPRLPGRRRPRRAGLPDAPGIPEVPVGKFNAGQKLYAAFVAGAVFVMLGTGLVMEWGTRLPLAWRTGATFVHDWLAFAAAVAVAGHLWMATRDPVALAGMRTGRVPAAWADREHPAWAPAAPEPESSRDKYDIIPGSWNDVG